MAPEDLLLACLDIANERMAEAIREVSLRRGYDPRDYALLAFGGAGPQHGCAVASLLEIGTVLVPADAGLLSALGLGEARLERVAERQILRSLDDLAGDLADIWAALAAEATAAVAREGVPVAEIQVVRRLASLRLRGQETALAIESASSRRASRRRPPRRCARRSQGPIARSTGIRPPTGRWKWSPPAWWRPRRGRAAARRRRRNRRSRAAHRRRGGGGPTSAGPGASCRSTSGGRWPRG